MPNIPPKKPKKRTAEQATQALRQSRGMVSIAARQLGVSTHTLRRYVAEYPTVRQALEEERAFMTDTAELALVRAIAEGQGWAVCFYLKTQGKDRGYVERHEVTGAGGKEITLRVVYDDDDSHA